MTFVTLQVSSTESHIRIFHVLWTSCTSKRRGHLFWCVSWGWISMISAKMIKNYGCKCCIVHDFCSSSSCLRSCMSCCFQCSFKGKCPNHVWYWVLRNKYWQHYVCAEFHSTVVGWELDVLDLYLWTNWRHHVQDSRYFQHGGDFHRRERLVKFKLIIFYQRAL